MSYTIAKIEIDDIDTSVAECMATIRRAQNCNLNLDELVEINRIKYKLYSDHILLVARDSEEKIVGFRFAHSIPEDGKVEGFRFTSAMLPDGFDFVLYDSDGGVRPDHRRRGISRALLREQHRQAKEKGYKKIISGTALSSPPMMILNLQEGFNVIDLIEARTNTWYTKALIFEKKL